MTEQKNGLYLPSAYGFKTFMILHPRSQSYTHSTSIYRIYASLSAEKAKSNWVLHKTLIPIYYESLLPAQLPMPPLASPHKENRTQYSSKLRLLNHTNTFIIITDLLNFICYIMDIWFHLNVHRFSMKSNSTEMPRHRGRYKRNRSESITMLSWEMNGLMRMGEENERTNNDGNNCKPNEIRNEKKNTETRNQRFV